MDNGKENGNYYIILGCILGLYREDAPSERTPQITLTQNLQICTLSKGRVQATVQEKGHPIISRVITPVISSY